MIPIILEALRQVLHPRFFETERGFQGQFQANLQAAGAVPPGAIVEQEYQKTLRLHGIRRRPDIIIHVPTAPGGNRQQGNLAVFALKLAARPAAAREDFAALDAILGALDYPLAAFVNVAARRTHADHYGGRYRDRLHFFAAWQQGNNTVVRHAYYVADVLIEV